MYELEDDVPLPPDAVPAQYRKYPFLTMKIGQSFVVPREHADKLTKAAAAWKRRHAGWNYAIRRDPKGVRLWRVT